MAEEVLAGRHALVTGGAQGLGAGMAQALAAAGAKVMIGDVQDDLAAETAAGIGGELDAPGRHRRGELGGRDRAPRSSSSAGSTSSSTTRASRSRA